MPTRTEDLIEANRRGLLTGQIKADFDSAVRSGLIKLPQTGQREGDFVPTPENLAATQRPAQPERTIGETLAGLGETALTAATGATTGTAGFGIGSVEGAIGELTGRLEPGEGLARAQELAQAGTFEPRTEAGKEFVGELGEKLGVLPPVIGATPIASLRSLIPDKNITAAIIKNPSKKRALLADEIRKGNPNIDNVTKALNETGDIITNKAAKKAVKVLGNDTKAQQTVSVLENMNNASKSQVSKVLDNIDRGRREPLFGQENRPSDVLGESLANRAKAIARINDKAKVGIGKAADTLRGKEVNIQNATNNFFNDLSELGVKFSQDADGRVKLDFSESTFTGGGVTEIERIANFIKSGAMDGRDAHRLKQFTRDLVDFGQGTESAVSARSQGVLKRLASGIDGVLDSTSPVYKKANDNFAKTIGLKNQFDKMAGKDIDIFSDLSKKALGGKARRLVSNAESRVSIAQTLSEADRVLGDFGVRFKDDIPSLNFAVTQLENIFKIEPAGSFQGRIQRAGVNLLEASASPIAATKLGADKLLSLAEPDFNKKMKALRLLIQKRSK